MHRFKSIETNRFYAHQYACESYIVSNKCIDVGDRRRIFNKYFTASCPLKRGKISANGQISSKTMPWKRLYILLCRRKRLIFRKWYLFVEIKEKKKRWKNWQKISRNHKILKYLQIYCGMQYSQKQKTNQSHLWSSKLWTHSRSRKKFHLSRRLRWMFPQLGSNTLEIAKNVLPNHKSKSSVCFFFVLLSLHASLLPFSIWQSLPLLFLFSSKLSLDRSIC